MTSQINYGKIDSNFPVAGQDNDTQGFRDNFSAIKNALQYANAEITDLQGNGAVLNAANNFGGNQIYNAELLYNSQTLYNHGTLNGSVTLDWKLGSVQLLTTSGNVAIDFSNWPSIGTSGSIDLIITISNISHNISLPVIVNQDGFVKPVTAGTYIFKFTALDGGDIIVLTNGSNNDAPTVVNSLAALKSLTVPYPGAVVAGGGANSVPVVSDGTNWRIG